MPKIKVEKRVLCPGCGQEEIVTQEKTEVKCKVCNRTFAPFSNSTQ